jgi:hypothetical protein
LSRVRDLDPHNKQATDGLRNALKYIKQDEGIDYMPKLDDTPLPELKRPTAVPVAQTTKKPEEVKKTEPVQEKPKVVEQKKSTPAPTPAPVKM